MVGRSRTGLVVACICVLSACAGPVPKIDAKQNSLAGIKTIDVIRPPEQESYTVMNIGSPGIAFGLIGGLIVAADQNSKQERLAKELKGQGSISSDLADDVAASLNRIGYVAKVENGPWEKKDGKATLSYEKIQSSADAVLVLTPKMIGFISPQFSTEYQPTITAVTTLLGKDRRESLYRGYHASGWQPKAKGWKEDAPSKKTFPSFNAIMADPKACMASLDDAAAAIAASIASDLKSRADTLAEASVAAPK